jgi:hypothetical protein
MGSHAAPTTLLIDRMKSDRDAEAVAQALLLLDDIDEVSVDLGKQCVSFRPADGVAFDAALRALQQAGFPARKQD